VDPSGLGEARLQRTRPKSGGMGVEAKRGGSVDGTTIKRSEGPETLGRAGSRSRGSHDGRETRGHGRRV